MEKVLRLKVLAILGLASFPAIATDYTGIATMLIGIPAFIGFNLVLAIFLALPASKARKIIASALLVPLVIAGLIISHDASSLMGHDNTGDWLLGAAYFALAAISFYMHYKLLSKQPVDGR
ncbi:hypothetical protein [Lysobacter sp. CFH 32150]|uniref:hypothetical protein n=1 Tax=Lysobacter sp. CFH 32150 TaxID=2927128 RepID=UPI001FA7E014|nr:hypothetical protein [Lysobacter sp. CFH 32150]MCI4569488.1 hypothetical protein [Lysobacter sp. CFH 32150]